MALIPHLRLLPTVNDKVQIQVLLPLESLQTDTADVRPVGIMAELVSFQVLLPLQSGSANVADEAPLDLVRGQVLLQVLLLRVRAMTLWTAEQHGPVNGRCDVHLARLRSLRLWRFLLVLALLLPLLAASHVSRRRTTIRALSLPTVVVVIVVVVRLLIRGLRVAEQLGVITVDDEPVQVRPVCGSLPLYGFRVELEELVELHRQQIVRLVLVLMLLLLL